MAKTPGEIPFLLPPPAVTTPPGLDFDIRHRLFFLPLCSWRGLGAIFIRRWQWLEEDATSLARAAFASLSSASRGSDAAVDFIREKQGAPERPGSERGAGEASRTVAGGLPRVSALGGRCPIPRCRLKSGGRIEMPRRERRSRHVRTRERRR